MGWPKEAYLYLRQIAKPTSRPQAGGNLLYAKSDNNLYLLDANGTEHAVGTAETLPVSIIDAKGDLIVGTADNTATRKAVGSDGQVLTADSASTGGIKWAAGTATSPREALFKISGTLVIGAGQTRLYNDSGSTWTISSIRSSVETAPAGGTVVVDVNKNGTTLFTTQANRPSISAAAVTSGKVTAINVTSVADGEYLTVDVDTTTSPAANLTVTVVFS